MTTTTRRISEETVLKLKNLQLELEKQGIRISQSELLKIIVDFSVRNAGELFTLLKYKENEDPLDKWLQSTYNGEKSDAVNDHDVVD